jgi:hypothetical protein
MTKEQKEHGGNDNLQMQTQVPGYEPASAPLCQQNRHKDYPET